MEKSDLVIFVCGVAGGGKSVLCERLAQHYGIEYVPTSGVLRSLIAQGLQGTALAATKNKGFWESEEGKQFMRQRASNPEFDRELDKELLLRVARGGLVCDSWTLPWLSKKGFKIWLEASDAIRFSRISQRNHSPLSAVAVQVRSKEEKSIALYERLYGFVWGKDLGVFDSIIDTDPLTKVEVFQRAVAAIDAWCSSKA